MKERHKRWCEDARLAHQQSEQAAAGKCRGH
jgi:hypothetical protein